MKKAVSAIKPTGTPHIGNYFGAMKQFVDFQDTHNMSVFVADLHALTQNVKPEDLRRQTIDVVKTYIAIGLDTEKVTLFKQSDVPEVAELTWFFNCLTTMPQLMRAHAFKDAEAKNKDINIGVFDYPILMAADILIQNAEIVPVGKDQKQHIEIAREVARKFNKEFGELFKEPKEYLIDECEIIPGIDGQKMSKSHNNIIPLLGTYDEIKKAVMKIPTDSASIDDPKDIDTILFQIHSLFLGDTEKNALKEKYQKGGMGYKEAKEMCIEDIEKYIKPMREKFQKISDEDVIQILEEGKMKIRKDIEPFMETVRRSIGLIK